MISALYHHHHHHHVSCHRSFILGASHQPLRLQVSHCSTFLVIRDVTSIAAICNESVECFLGMASKFSFKPFITVPVTAVSTGIITHFMFHICCVCVRQLFRFSFIYAFAWHFYQLVLPLPSVYVFYLLFLSVF